MEKLSHTSYIEIIILEKIYTFLLSKVDGLLQMDFQVLLYMKIKLQNPSQTIIVIVVGNKWLFQDLELL